jgi:hypothetical protein
MLVFCLLLITKPLIAGEGMWLPLFLKSLNEKEMKDMGMKIKAQDIYSVNKGSLKDAIVHFGGFCTAEIISEQGLLLTNHHCGYGQIQSHSSIDNNMIKNGFWAKNHKEELPNPGLFATLIDWIDDVTDKALVGVTENMTSKERQSTIDKNLKSIAESYTLKEFQEVKIRPFFEGNQYFAFVTTTYNDVRLVGTPPESIGKFGSDTDNWVWPRHTGDFSLFRIYASPNNMPAEYSENNVPYKPKHSLPINIGGIKEGDFTMVFGFPGRTQEYLPSYAVEQIVNTLNPAKIEIRDTALKIVDKYMRADETTKIQYSSKYARIANYWKKWIGESLGLTKTKAIEKKKDYEKSFTLRVLDNRKYSNLLPEFEKLYSDIAPYAYARDYYNEVAGRNVEALTSCGYVRRLVSTYENNGEAAYYDYGKRVRGYFESFYKDYNSSIDKEVFASLISLYKNKVDTIYHPSFLKGESSTDKMATYLFESSVITNEKKMLDLLEMHPDKALEILKDDRLYQFAAEWADLYTEKINKPYVELDDQINELQRVYMKAQMEAFPDRRFYPDANSTMRVTYGNVKSYSPKDAVVYSPFTTLDGVMEKYVPGDYEFDVDQKLIDLYNKKDYGKYADKKGKLPVCFIGTNHTTGGNSGSPAIDAKGNLIGLNFDRAWEGTMSDINYDASICRNIMVDARYILFIIDKYAGAGHLIDEMKLVKK